MSPEFPLTFDKSGVLIEKIGDHEDFPDTNTYLPSKKGVVAVFDVDRLEADFLDIARNPNLNKADFERMRPKPPKIADNLSREQIEEEEESYRKQLKEYQIIMSGLDMQVSPADMFKIKQYMKPFRRAVHMTSAIKGRRFGAFTKYPNEEQPKGLFGMNKGG